MIHLYFFLVGSILASFLGLVIDRFPEHSIVTPASHCDSCGHRLGVLDLIPIFSQLIHRFSCRFCGVSLPYWYVLFELFLGGLFLLFSFSFLSIADLILLVMGSTLAIYDIRTQEYPILVWLIFQIPLVYLGNHSLLEVIFFLLALWAYFRPIGIGAGDFLFLLSCSAIFKIQEILILIQIASLSGILFFLLTNKKGRLAFVPCLMIGVFFLIFYKMWLAG